VADCVSPGRGEADIQSTTAPRLSRPASDGQLAGRADQRAETSDHDGQRARIRRVDELPLDTPVLARARNDTRHDGYCPAPFPLHDLVALSIVSGCKRRTADEELGLSGQGPVLVTVRSGQGFDDPIPGFPGKGLTLAESCARPLLHPIRLQAPFLLGLDAPDRRVAADLAAGGLPGRFGVDAPAAQLLRKGLACRTAGRRSNRGMDSVV
jgi:hypothetical protein